MKKLSLFAIICFFALTYTNGQSIRNGYLWSDNLNKPIQAHGPDITKHNGIYYMIGNDMSDNYSFKGINLYSSADLLNWTFESCIIDKNTNTQLANGERITERPVLLYNEKDNRFVVWIKYQNGSYTNNKAAVFYCNTIDGKYTYVKEFYPKGYDSNDCSIFIDDDGSAYFISTNKANKSLNLYKLSDDYMDADEATILFPGQNKEAPVIFKKDNLYYILSSYKTGWDPNQMQSSTSTSLKTGWSDWKNIGDQYSYHTQPSDVLTINGTEKQTFIYIGDRWKDPGLPGSKIIMMPLSVNDGNLELPYTHEFTIDLTSGIWEEYDDNSYIPRTNWSLVSASSEQPGYEATKAFDEDLSTIWHSNWNNQQSIHPHEIIIDLGDSYSVTGMMYIPRQDKSTNGNIREFQLLLSENGSDWNIAAGGYISYQSEIYFPQQNAHFMKFISLSAVKDKPFAAAAEIKLMSNNDYNTKNYDILYQMNLSGSWKKASQTSITTGETIKFGASPTIYGSYLWSGPNNFYSNTRIATIENATSSNSGHYTLSYLDQANHAHLSTFDLQVNKLNEINNSIIPETILVYPNPTHGAFNINLNNYTQASVEIYNLLGQMVYKHSQKSEIITLNSDFSFDKGIYSVHITSLNNKLVCQKLIID